MLVSRVKEEITSRSYEWVPALAFLLVLGLSISEGRAAYWWLFALAGLCLLARSARRVQQSDRQSKRHASQAEAWSIWPAAGYCQGATHGRARGSGVRPRRPLFSRLMGRPVQRWRARRLARKGKVNCVLFAPSSPSVLPRRLLSGAADVSPGGLHLYDADLWVIGAELPADAGPADERSEGDLLFRPPSRIFTLRTHRGTVRWAVLDWQADWALDRLGLGKSTEG